MKELGTSSTDSPRTPTLRQAFKAKGGELPQVSCVKVVFLPGKFTQYGFITEADYKVSVGESSPLYGVLVKELSTWLEDGRCIAVRIDDGQKGYWTLVDLEENEADWEDCGWGLKLFSLRSRKKTRPQKNHSTVDHEQCEIDFDSF